MEKEISKDYIRTVSLDGEAEVNSVTLEVITSEVQQIAGAAAVVSAVAT